MEYLFIAITPRPLYLFGYLLTKLIFLKIILIQFNREQK